MAKAKQVEMFEQKKVAVIEKWADVFDEKRSLIAGRVLERDNAEMKLMEACHANADKLDRQESTKGEKLLVYKRGDYTVVVKNKESINVKIKDASKPAVEGEPVGDEPPAGDEGGE